MGESYFPATFSLSDGAVTAVETSPANPKVRMDSSGFFTTDANGNKLATINPDGSGVFDGGITLPPSLFSKRQGLLYKPGAFAPINDIRWVRQSDGLLVAEVYSDITTFSPEFGTPQESKELTLLLHDKSQHVDPNTVWSTGSVNIEATDDDSVQPGSSLSVTTAGQVSAGAGNQSKKILDAQGNSDFLQRQTMGSWQAQLNLAYGGPAYWDFNTVLLAPDSSVVQLASLYASTNNVVQFKRSCSALVFASVLSKNLPAGARSDMSLRKNNTIVTRSLAAATPDGYAKHTLLWVDNFINGDAIGPVLEAGGNEYDGSEGQWSTFGVFAIY